MKVCIVTLQYTNNFGAVLQCYALQKSLATLGCQVDVLDYRALRNRVLRFWEGWGLRSRSPLASIRARCLKLRHAEESRRKFETFRRQHLNQTPRIDSLPEAAELLSGYDAIIVGSDQVWNQNWHHPVYYLGGESFSSLPPRVARIAYAASAGNGDFEGARKLEIAQALGKFSRISVRDAQTHSLLLKNFALESAITCDPTVLTDITEVDSSAPDSGDGYVLAYFLHEHSRKLAQRTTQYFAKKLKLPVFAIVVSAHEAFKLDGAAVHLSAVGPAEWHKLFRQASFVCTDSFHGSIFSAKFGKPFACCIANPGTGLRLADAAARYGFSDCIVSDPNTLDECAERIFSRDPNRSIENMRSHSMESFEFLKGALPPPP